MSAQTDYAWLIETAGPHYLFLDAVGSLNLFRWTRDANKAMRFARKRDALAAIDGFRKIEPDLFRFPTEQTVDAVEHGWDGPVDESKLQEAHRAVVPVVTMKAIATAIVKRVAELPNRSSPDDWPEAMLVTSAELHRVVMEEFDAEIG